MTIRLWSLMSVQILFNFPWFCSVINSRGTDIIRFFYQLFLSHWNKLPFPLRNTFNSISLALIFVRQIRVWDIFDLKILIFRVVERSELILISLLNRAVFLFSFYFFYIRVIYFSLLSWFFYSFIIDWLAIQGEFFSRGEF